jgi:hypothetical protein
MCFEKIDVKSFTSLLHRVTEYKESTFPNHDKENKQVQFIEGKPIICTKKFYLKIFFISLQINS